MRLNIRKKLKTGSLNSRFTGSKTEDVLQLAHFWKFWNLKLLLTYDMSLSIGVARGPAPHWNPTNDKNVTKKTIVSSVFFSIFASNTTRVQQ